jgi:hypothetical protein
MTRDHALLYPLGVDFHGGWGLCTDQLAALVVKL